MDYQAGEKARLAEVLFSIASEDRLTLLAKIGEEKRRIRDLSKFIDATAQECSRHVGRLVDSRLVRKDSSGFYEITSLGRALTEILPSYDFLFSHKDYFSDHDPTVLPKGFLGRIGELSNGEFVGHFSEVLELIKKVVSTGRDHVWLLSDKPLVVGLVIGQSFSSKDIPVRLLGKDFGLATASKVRSALPNSELAVLADVKIALAINENLAGVCFPDLGRRIDFGAGFVGTDSNFIGWCSDLFEHYWQTSNRI
ncbi:MAG: hypothetical protein QXV32_06075 [Conexivisphaerales archaeon]